MQKFRVLYCLIVRFKAGSLLISWQPKCGCLLVWLAGTVSNRLKIARLDCVVAWLTSQLWLYLHLSSHLNVEDGELPETRGWDTAQAKYQKREVWVKPRFARKVSNYSWSTVPLWLLHFPLFFFFLYPESLSHDSRYGPFVLPWYSGHCSWSLWYLPYFCYTFLLPDGQDAVYPIWQAVLYFFTQVLVFLIIYHFWIHFPQEKHCNGMKLLPEIGQAWCSCQQKIKW